MYVEEVFIWEKTKEKPAKNRSVANQNAGFALIHLSGDTNLNYPAKLTCASATTIASCTAEMRPR